jgi:hypothetical protein
MPASPSPPAPMDADGPGSGHWPNLAPCPFHINYATRFNASRQLVTEEWLPQAASLYDIELTGRNED